MKKTRNFLKAMVSLFAAVLCAATSATPLALDTSALTNDWDKAEISGYKCKTAFKDFGKAVADANAEAEAKRTKIDATMLTFLKQQMEKAQEEGDLDRLLVFKRALESARVGAIVGNDDAIAKLRESYEKQLALVDRNLLATGLGAEQVLYATLDWQKSEKTKKGDIAEAQKIAAFQKKVEEWPKVMAKQIEPSAARAAREKDFSRNSPAPTPPQTPRAQPLSAPEVKLEAGARIVTIDARDSQGTSIGHVEAGDRIEIQYIDGKWTHWPERQVASPDANGCSLCLCKRGDVKYVLAHVPQGTKESPFRYFIDGDDAGELALRIKDDNCHDNVGSVRYAVRVIPAGGATEQPASAQCGQPLAIPTDAKIVTIEATNGEGTHIGTLRAGDIIEIQYVSGKWCQNLRDPLENPDVDSRKRLLVVEEDETVTKVPRGTKEIPFAYIVKTGGGILLRMEDGHYGDNAGVVRYAVRVMPAGGTAAQPQASAMRPTVQSGFLLHRWSFNGNLKDSVSGQDARAIGNVASEGNSYRLHGAHDEYIDLGSDVLPRDGRGATIEIWVTRHSHQVWSRVFDIGSGTDDYLDMSWCDASDSLAFRVLKLGYDYRLAPCECGREYHVALVCSPEKDGTWLVDAYQQNATDGRTIKKVSISSAGKDWSPARMGMRNCWLGRSQYSHDRFADASYNEVRIWATALTEEQLTESARRGPDAIIPGEKGWTTIWQ